MGRPATERPPTELLIVTTRLIRQVTVDTKLSPRRRKALLEHYEQAKRELEAEVKRRG